MRSTYRLLTVCLAFSTLSVLPARAGTNILVNYSFETNSQFNDERADHWNLGNPDSHGGYWGTFSRRDWRHTSGNQEGTLLGTWINRGPDGGVWQEGAAVPGATYEASGWFFADAIDAPGGAWTSLIQELKIEFYSSSFGDSLLTTTLPLSNIGGTNINPAFVQRSFRAVAPTNAAWARIVVAMVGAGPSGAIQFDDLSLSKVISPFQDFNNWTAMGSDGTYTQDDWVVSTGKTQTADSHSGYCANLGNPGTVATNGHFIRNSAPIEPGIGTVSFWYRNADTSGLTAVTYDLQVSANGTSWTTVGGITNVVNTNYVQFSKFIYEPSKYFLRIYHTAGAGRLLVDDLTVADPTLVQRYVDFDDWPSSDTTNSCYSFSGWDLCTGRIVTVDNFSGPSAVIQGGATGSNYLQSPFFSNGVGTVSFEYRAQTNTSPISFSLQTSTDTVTWTTMATYTGVSDITYQAVSEYMYLTNGTFVRFRYDSGSSTNNLLIDSIDVAVPVLHRSQNFDTWSDAGSRFSTYDFQGWRVVAAEIDTNTAVAGQSARMRNTVGSNATIRTPFFADGVGTISFSYKVNDTNPPSTPPGVRYFIQTSPDGVTWVTNDTLSNLSNQTFVTYSKYFFLTNGLYVRLYHTNGASEVAFDNISIDIPRLPADVLLTGFTTPVNPYTNDSVFLDANVTLLNSAVTTNMTAFYRLGTSGAFTALGMRFTNGITYVTTSAIPPQAVGSTVQYYVRCDFDGPAASSNSPKYYPSTGSNPPAFYRMPRTTVGRAWINEINYYNDGGNDTQEFVEVCGPAGIDLSGWQVDLVLSGTNNGSFFSYALYTIPNGIILSNEANGFGFFVLGDPGLSASDVILTNICPDDSFSQISDGINPSGVRLYNEAGGVEQFISYAGALLLSTQIAAVEEWPSSTDPNSLQLAGLGSAFTNFIWSTNSMTPGGINIGETLAQTPEPPTVYVASMILGTNVVISYTGNSNNWFVLPYFTTNLSSPQTWQAVTPYTTGTNSLWFNRDATQYKLYRVNVTN